MSYDFGKGVFDQTPREKAVTFHAWLFSCLPASPVEILCDLEVSRRCKLIPSDFPRDAAELSEAMAALAKRGLVEKRELQFFWKAEPVRVEPQMELFA